MQLTLIGIGTGNPDHLTLEAVRAINAQDLILIPRKGERISQPMLDEWACRGFHDVNVDFEAVEKGDL